MGKYGKIICAVILTVSMLLTSMPVFAAGEAVSQSSEAYKTYLIAAKKMQNAKSIVMTGRAKGTEYEGNEIVDEYSAKIETRILYNNKNELQMSMNLTDDDGSSIDYYKDGYLYRDYNGEKRKDVYSESEILWYAAVLNWQLPKRLFETATVEAVEGGKRIKLVMLIADSDDIYDSLFGTYDENYSGNPSLDRLSIYITVGDDGNVKSYQIVLSEGYLYYDEDDSKANMSVSMNIVSVNRLTKIDFPADLKNYK